MGQQIVREMRLKMLAGIPPSGILRWLMMDKDIMMGDVMVLMMNAFGLEFSELLCVPGWRPDGTGELSDKYVDDLLVPRITARRGMWGTASW
jgi:hypothetical protein